MTLWASKCFTRDGVKETTSRLSFCGSNLDSDEQHSEKKGEVVCRSETVFLVGQNVVERAERVLQTNSRAKTVSWITRPETRLQDTKLSRNGTSMVTLCWVFIVKEVSDAFLSTFFEEFVEFYVDLCLLIFFIAASMMKTQVLWKM